ncbi:MAG TPA: POTRA domain-containing protein, partial [Polyangiaceae bacterium]|nr:POTRA domain-containing protein [Polyangiaceae bacterium]
MGLPRPLGRLLAGGALASAVLFSLPGRAEESTARATADDVPDLGPPPGDALRALFGKPVTRIEVVTRGGRWEAPVTLRRARPGDILTGELARRALQELADTGRYGEVTAEAESDGDGALLRLVVLPRRIVAGVRIFGGQLADDETARAAGLDVSDEVTAPALAACAERVRQFYVRSGFPDAAVAPDAIDTDDPMRVVVVLHIIPGTPVAVESRVFHVSPAPSDELRELLASYSIAPGDRADEDAISRADRDEQELLRKGGYHVAEVSHEMHGSALSVIVRAGPLVHVRFEGNHHFDDSDLEGALDLDEGEDRSPATLAAKIQKFYVEHGFFDATVKTSLRGGERAVENDLVLSVREGDVVRVALREYPCLSGSRSADDVGDEIDSFLSEVLPGTSFLGPTDPRVVDSALGPRGETGARVAPESANPWRTYVPEVYERATRHLQELYRSEGYLSATVGPVVLMRRTCERKSPAGTCIPIGDRVRPYVECPVGASVPEDAAVNLPACVPSVEKGIRCESEVALHIPVKLGPRAILWDAAFEGNQVVTEAELLSIADLPLGEPVSQAELENARRRLLEEYAERGFAFAVVEQRAELSGDRTRARARFSINEHERVRVKDIIVRGAERTNEG